jgi:hypothetical protein
VHGIRNTQGWQQQHLHQQRQLLLVLTNSSRSYRST